MPMIGAVRSGSFWALRKPRQSGVSAGGGTRVNGLPGGYGHILLLTCCCWQEKSGAANTVHVSSKCIDMLDAASNETGTLAEPSQVNPHFDREGRSSEWEPWASDGRWLIKRKEVKTSATLSYLLQLQGSRSERGE